ncbi:tetratricopeptide repeat protein [Calothrix sp. UHCC 0171]|uniref:tetratricopeptide repeat protein n=1 Tax=Calothrix sp. UHCC 0171 TaxID=3110245 RepID=UPI002B1FA035|nr:tetratricopeptide repeat protein [Calothrix sp. UHCC 0171]MEA5572591.1 tetratricopeptide repeat protein [Calothrix sp. UHCC 0171]
MWLVAIFVCLGWMISLCLHEFGHAIVAYWGGDTSVKEKGYLTLNPLKYTDPGLSLLFPLFFLMLGGFALPGGAVYINTQKLRSRWWNSAVSAAGCVAEVFVVITLAVLFHAIWNQEEFNLERNGENSLYISVILSIAYVIFLNIYVIFINLLPIPGLDGYGIIQPWLPVAINKKLEKFSSYGFWILIALLWFYRPFGQFLRNISDSIISLLSIPNIFVDVGGSMFRTHAQYIVLGLIALLWLFRDKRKDLYRKGTQLISDGKYEKAIAILDRAIAAEPSYNRAWMMRGYGLYRLERYEDALVSYDKAIELQPDVGEPWYYKGIIFAEMQQINQALDSYNKAIEIQPNYVDALCQRGYLLLDEENYEQALTDFEQAIAIDKNNSFVWYGKGDALSQLQHDVEAINAYQQVLKIEPKSNAWHNLVQLLEKLERYEEVIAIYDTKLKYQPENANIWNRRGLILQKLNRDNEAKISFQQAKQNAAKTLRRKPEDADSWFQKGLALTATQNHLEAIPAYQQAIQIQPDFAPAFYNIACCYAQENNLELAIHNLEKAISLNPDLYLNDAKTDSDFDKIRENPAFQALLQTE